MKKEKGFTLIELLAVIVILAVLMVVAVPKILNVINKTKESAAESSVKLLKDAIKTQVTSRELTDNKFEQDEDGCYTFNFNDQQSGNAKKLNVKNKEQITGSIKYCNGNFKDDKIKSKDASTNNVICKRATTLHTEKCNISGTSYYCSGAGYSGKTITYGNLGVKGTLTSGDAFDCDVNGDGEYDSNSERFYYVSNYYNTTTKSFEDDTAVLIYYNNVGAGIPTATATYAYDSSGENWHGPRTAIKELPTTSQWNNVSLKNDVRAIISNKDVNTTPGGTLPSDFSYAGYAARLLTIQEIKVATNNNNILEHGGLDNFTYLLENTQFSNDSAVYKWCLEAPASGNSSDIWVINGSFRSTDINNSSSSSNYAVRPAIEILKSDISY